MATLNSIAEPIALALGQQFNQTFLQSIKEDIIDYRALFIRQDLTNNPLSYTDYLQTFCIELEEVNKSECPAFTPNAHVLKSKQKVPKPLRLKHNGRVSFKYVGSADRSTVLTFSTGQELKYAEHLPFQDNVIYYTITNGYLYVLNNLELCKLLIEEVVADPRDIQDCDNPDVFADDIDFPIPADMVANIKTAIKQAYPLQVADGKEINIDKDDRD